MARGRLKRPESEEEVQKILKATYDEMFVRSSRLGTRIARTLVRTKFITATEAESLIESLTEMARKGLQSGLKKQLFNPYRPLNRFEKKKLEGEDDELGVHSGT